MTQENEDAQVIAAECIRQSEEGNYERALFRKAGETIQRLLAELEAVGAGGVQPLTPQQCELAEDGVCEKLDCANHAPQHSAAAAPPQKPELRVGQIWRMRDGREAEIAYETTNALYPFWCLSGGKKWNVTRDGKCYRHYEVDHLDDLIELISDVQKDGES